MKITSTRELKNYAKHLAKKIEQITGYEAIVYQPMGLRAAIRISWQDKQNIKKGTINLTYEEDNKVYYDTKEKSNNYPKGSIREMNGLNIKTKPLPYFVKAIWEVAKI